MKLVLALALMSLGTGPALACRLALALALDVSASVDIGEYRFQATGLSRALTSPDVRRAILADTDAPVALMAYEWAGQAEQRVIVGWTMLDSEAAISDVAARIRRHGRTKFLGKTSIGSALIFAEQVFATAPTCDRRTLDLSGDGKNNTGPEPPALYAAGTLSDVTVNALAVGIEVPIDMPGDPTFELHLDVYFERQVIRGRDAFVEVAEDYADYENAMTRKLLREIGTMQLSEAGR